MAMSGEESWAIITGEAWQGAHISWSTCARDVPDVSVGAGLEFTFREERGCFLQIWVNSNIFLLLGINF